MKRKRETAKTVWSSFSDRGWLKAITEPYDPRRTYTYATMPVYDLDIQAWREQVTLGTYLDYSQNPVFYRSAESRATQPGNILCVCYASKTSRYIETQEQAKAWIEFSVARVRPVFEAHFAEVGMNHAMEQAVENWNKP